VVAAVASHLICDLDVATCTSESAAVPVDIAVHEDDEAAAAFGAVNQNNVAAAETRKARHLENDTPAAQDLVVNVGPDATVGVVVKD
jgi:hypothetical protein